MDEPTTHLDMASIDALIEALKQYQGTLVFISHDVYFIRALAQTVLHISAGNLTPYAGDYDYYLEKSGALRRKQGARRGREAHRQPARRGEPAPAEAAPKPLRRQDEGTKAHGGRGAPGRFRRAQEGAVARRTRSSSEIAALEKRHKEIVADMESPETYARRRRRRAPQPRAAGHTERLDQLNEEWADASRAGRAESQGRKRHSEFSRGCASMSGGHSGVTVSCWTRADATACSRDAVHD